MSALGYSFIAGLLEHAEALTRGGLPDGQLLQAAGEPAARTRARPGRPAYATYGGNDRTHMLRVPDPGRVEDRCIDGSANPYLALSALIAAGLDGIERGPRPGRPLRAQPAQAQPSRGGRARAARHAHDAVARARPPRSATTSCATAWARPPRATTSTTSSPPSAPRPGPRTPRSRPGSSTATCRPSDATPPMTPMRPTHRLTHPNRIEETST